jgi:hypothetical protein
MRIYVRWALRDRTIGLPPLRGSGDWINWIGATSQAKEQGKAQLISI